MLTLGFATSVQIMDWLGVSLFCECVQQWLALVLSPPPEMRTTVLLVFKEEVTSGCMASISSPPFSDRVDNWT